MGTHSHIIKKNWGFYGGYSNVIHSNGNIVRNIPIFLTTWELHEESSHDIYIFGN